MRIRPTVRKLAWPLALLFTSLAGCEAEFEDSITPLVIETLPPPVVFITPGLDQSAAPLETEPALGATIAPVEVTPPTVVPIEDPPELEPMCTTDYLRLRDQPATAGEELVTMPPGSQVQWTGAEATADGYTWYELAYTDEIQGWAASLWLLGGECGAVVVGGGIFPLVPSAYVSGYDWLDADSGTEHFGIDVHSETGETAISSPYAGQVVDSDACAGCIEADDGEGNTLGEFDLDYNYGYGAMMVLEYAYGDLTEEERTDISEAGFELVEGQSIYLMLAHLDPNETIAGDGTAFAQGDGLASIGNSGNSDGAHIHLEMAINDSGLTPGEDQVTVNFWLDTVVERVFNAEEQSERQGNRVDPTPLFGE